MENNQSKSKIILIVVAVILVIVLGVLAFLVYSGRGGAVGEKVKTFLPFGGGGEEREGGEVVVPPGGGGIIEGEGNKADLVLKKLHDAPVAGLYPFLRPQAGRPTATSTPDVVVRYIERGLGHIYETNMVTRQEIRISNETRLKVYEALWGNGGNGVAIRYLGDDANESIRTYSITLRDIKNGTTTEEGRIVESQGVFLRENISDAVVSQGKGDRIFYVLPGEQTTVGITTLFSGEKQSQVFSSPLREWLPQWPKDTLITLTTKPSASVPGILFFLDPVSQKLTKVLSGISGLTTNTNSTGDRVLYSKSIRGGFEFFDYSAIKDSHAKISVTTLPDKCVWSKAKKTVAYCGIPSAIPSGEYPDTWYQGIVSFGDTIWMIDVETGLTTLVANPEELSGEAVDAVSLALDPSESYLFFINKKDSAPWSLKLANN